MGLPDGSVVKTLPDDAGDVRDESSIPGSGRSPGGGNGNPLQCSRRENPTDRGTWRATVHGVAKRQTLLTRESVCLKYSPFLVVFLLVSINTWSSFSLETSQGNHGFLAHCQPASTSQGFPGCSAGKEFACHAGDLHSIPGLGRSPGEGNWLPTPVSWPGEFHAPYGLWARKESDVTDRPSHNHLRRQIFSARDCILRLLQRNERTNKADIKGLPWWSSG